MAVLVKKGHRVDVKVGSGEDLQDHRVGIVELIVTREHESHKLARLDLHPMIRRVSLGASHGGRS